MEQLVNEVYKPVKNVKQFRKVISYNINDIWSMDLVFMNDEKMIDTNDGYKYILFCIDLYSRYAFGRGLKTKTSKEVKSAIESIIKEAKAKPKKVYVDQGSEFYNKELQTYFKKLNIELYSTYGPNKASVIERFNRTIKTMMFKQLLINKNWKWITILKDLINKYNNNNHRGIENNKPIDVYNKKVILTTQIEEKNDAKPKFKVNDRVRISYNKGVFDKSYFPNWSYEIFIIKEVKPTNPYTYKLIDYKKQEVKGSFYENELQKTEQKEGVFLIEKILKTRYNKKKEPTHYLIKWLGYPESQATWEPASNIVNDSELF